MSHGGTSMITPPSCTPGLHPPYVCKYLSSRLLELRRCPPLGQDGGECGYVGGWVNWVHGLLEGFGELRGSTLGRPQEAGQKVCNILGTPTAEHVLCHAHPTTHYVIKRAAAAPPSPPGGALPGASPPLPAAASKWSRVGHLTLLSPLLQARLLHSVWVHGPGGGVPAVPDNPHPLKLRRDAPGAGECSSSSWIRGPTLDH